MVFGRHLPFKRRNHQQPVRQAVGQGGLFVHIRHRQGEFGGKVGKPVQTFKTRHAIQSAPNAFGGAFFQQDCAVPVADNQPVKRQGLHFEGSFFTRQLGGAVLLFASQMSAIGH